MRFGLPGRLIAFHCFPCPVLPAGIAREPRTPVLIASALLQSLLEDESLLRATDEDGLFAGFTALHWSAHGGHTAVGRALLDEANRQGGGDSTNPLFAAKDNDGDTPLHVAVSWGHLDYCGMLLEAGASLTDKASLNNQKKTPMDLATPAMKAELKRVPPPPPRPPPPPPLVLRGPAASLPPY